MKKKMVVVRAGEAPALYAPRQLIARPARVDEHGAMDHRSVRARSASAIEPAPTAAISDTPPVALVVVRGSGK
jgi:hypothetical protein